MKQNNMKKRRKNWLNKMQRRKMENGDGESADSPFKCKGGSDIIKTGHVYL